MTVRVIVQKIFHIPGRGSVATVLLADGRVDNGDALLIEGIGVTVRVTSVDLHTRQTAEGPLLGLGLDSSSSAQITAGSVLVAATD